MKNIQVVLSLLVIFSAGVAIGIFWSESRQETLFREQIALDASMILISNLALRNGMEAKNMELLEKLITGSIEQISANADIYLKDLHDLGQRSILEENIKKARK